LIEKDDEEIKSKAIEITKDSLGDYDKGKAVFKWIAENIEYDFEASLDDPRSAKQTLTENKGDCDEIAYLYAALMRSIDIPTKLVSGTYKDELHVWNEIKVNGKWVIVDATWGLGYTSDNETFIKKLDTSYYNPFRSVYEAKFENIEYLGY